MKQIVLLLVFGIIFFSAKAQSSLLIGDLTVNNESGWIWGTYKVTDFQTKGTNLHFSISNDFIIRNLKFNNEWKRVIADTVNCNDGRMYIVELDNEIQQTDTLEFFFTGQFEVFGENHPRPYDHKGLISFNYGILRATEQSQWYPMLKTGYNHCYGTDIPLRYEIKVKPEHCKSVYIGSGAPQYSDNANKLHFSSKQPVRVISLITGNYD